MNDDDDVDKKSTNMLRKANAAFINMEPKRADFKSALILVICCKSSNYPILKTTNK